MHMHELGRELACCAFVCACSLKHKDIKSRSRYEIMLHTPDVPGCPCSAASATFTRSMMSLELCKYDEKEHNQLARHT